MEHGSEREIGDPSRGSAASLPGCGVLPANSHPCQSVFIRGGFCVSAAESEYIFPCDFLGDPDAARDPSQSPVLFRSLLGLTGVVDKIRLLLDGRPSASARYGMLVVETS